MNVELVFKTAAPEWDSLLKREVASGPDTSFVLLVQRQTRFVFRIAYALLRNAADAEDIVQDTFLKLFRTGAWKHIEDEKAFLARMVWRLAGGKRSRRRFSPESELSEIACGDCSPETSAIELERGRMIHRLIDALPKNLRVPLALSSIEEMSTTQIAAVMDLPEGTVRRRLTEARTLVKEKMARMQGGPHA